MDRPIKKKRAPNKPKESYEDSVRTRALRHMATYLNGVDGHYINKRYWEGFRTGLLQAVVQEEGSEGNLEKIKASTKTILKKKEWEKDPLQNGVLNGRRFALSYLLNIDYEMITGSWITPSSQNAEK